jgi:hypothetical protein
MKLSQITPATTPALLNALLMGDITKDELIRVAQAKIESTVGEDRQYWCTFKKTLRGEDEEV